MLDVLVIAAGFVAGVLAIVAINGARRGGPVPVVAGRAERSRPAPPPAAGYPPPAPPGRAPELPSPGQPPPSALDDHGIRVNLPGAAPAPAAPPPAPVDPTSAPSPADVGATVVAGGPSLTKADAGAGAGSAPAAARLELVDGSAAVELVDEPVSLGRGSDQVLRVRDTKASRAHAVVRRRSKGRPGWEVADQGSANGTYLNGHRIPDGRVAPLRDGDRIGIGDSDVRYVEQHRPTTPPPPPAPVVDPDATQIQR